MGRPFFALLLVVALLFGATQASALLFWVMGPWTAVGIQHDGTATHMAFGQNLPRPAWVPVYPGAAIVQSSFLTSPQMPSGFGTLQIGTRAGFDDVRRFYLDRLAAEGFEVADRGIAPLNPATALYLGIAGNLAGRRTATDDQVDVLIRTPDGLLPSRMIEIHWRKISESPVTAPAERP
ncbi:MAG: hypothetical protein ACJ8D9_21150 [Xanthobacteraceae bacterium]